MTTQPSSPPTPGVSVVAELPLPGIVPRYEVPQWRERYGVVAGITGRGEGEPAFDLGLWGRGPVGDAMSRWRSFRQVEPAFRGTVLGHQVHQTRVAWHGDVEGWLQLDGIDGHATGSVGVMLTVTVADCIPVYLLDPVHRAIGLLHSGWRGTAGGILPGGIELLHRAVGSVASDLVMHCGVGICGQCYEVGSEVMEGCGLTAAGPGPWHADLRQALAGQARQLGVQLISTSQWCSAHDRDRFFSHRGSGGSDGRMVAYFGLAPVPH